MGRTGKRSARPETWKKNVRKTLKLQGKSHVSQSGKVVSEKKVSSVDCSKCRFGCKDITGEDRKAIFDIFYALPSYERQKQFVCANIDEQESKTVFGKDQCPLPKKRSVARAFYCTVKGSRVRVCKKFFLATLNIGEGYVSHAMANSDMGTFTGGDGRGRHRAHNRTHDSAVEGVRDHIRSFPCVESHYTRKGTKRQYLDASLTVTKMYHLYKEKCAADGKVPVSCRKYRDVFNSEFNLSFHKPKKDQCMVCVNYAMKQKQEQGLVNEKEEQEFQRHTELKMRAKAEKTQDKELAKKDPTKHVVTLDLQAVLPTPCGLVSQLYYKRKLSVYNFTVYSLADGKATCFVWDETNGRRGSVEIATCLFLYLKSLPVTVKDVILYSDCCGGQNRNQYLAAAFLYALENIPNISITHKYLETGHTQMECDSMHSAISFAKKANPVFIPSGWDIIVRMARRTNPYTVIPIRFTQILDFKYLASQIIRNTKVDKNNKRLCLSSSSARRRQPDLAQIIRPRYTEKLPVSEAKKRDLVSLCRSGVIPEDHHPFYENLPTASSKVDRLEEPDVEDVDSGEETD
ncbi:hypothetical protein BaRGS_00008355 [Batillaria attramentaria]|uniref:Uncharacterized protein n=1 Tax=Batillaria attramentaria TaxID=370345 RepID=A0ABD0LN85_9CAEN